MDTRRMCDCTIFEKTDSLTSGLLHVNDDSILREVDQGDDRYILQIPCL